MNTNIKCLPAFIIIFLLSLFYPFSSQADGTIYQYSTIASLMLGNYDGELTMETLKKHGDTGLGTFNSLDGEMVIINGKIFKIDFNGKTSQVPPSTRTPFAVALKFETDSILKLDNVSTLDDLNTKISQALESDNIFYAIRIDGEFSSMRTRSVPAQEKPYSPLPDVIRKQKIFKFEKIKGTMIGIKSPAYVQNISIPGFHWHFITKDRKAGGHVLDCSFKGLPAKVGAYTDFYLQLPETADFLSADLTSDNENSIKKVEKNSRKD